MSKLTENPDIPPLAGWMKLTDAAERLGMTRQYISRVASNGGFSTLHRIGEGQHALFVVEEHEVESKLEARTKLASEADARKAEESVDI